MTATSKLNSRLFFLLYLVLIFVITYLLLPKSVEEGYMAYTVSYVYLPELGLDSELTIFDPRLFIAYVALLKVISTVLNTGPLVTTHIMGFLSVVLIILSYALLLRVLPGDEKAKKAIICIFPLLYMFWDAPAIFTGYLLAPAMILSFSILFCVLYWYKKGQQSYAFIFVVALVSFIALGLFWHSLQVITYLFIVFFILVTGVPSILKKGKTAINWNLLTLVTVIFIATWFYLREIELAFILRNPHLSFDLASLFTKGDFAGEYSFRHAFPVEYIDKIRYAAYILVYATMGLVAIKYFRSVFTEDKMTSSKVPLAYSLVLTFLISDIALQLLYFIATRTVAPRILITLSYPFILIYLNSKIGQQISFVAKLNFKKFLTGFLVIAFLLTATSLGYIYIKHNPAQNINEQIYQSSFFWIVDHSAANQVLSDSATSGQYQLLFSYHDIYERRKISMISICLRIYEKIVNSTYKNREGDILVLNTELYRKRLIFGALEAWNKFEPIPPERISQNPRLNVIYNDGRVLVAQ